MLFYTGAKAYREREEKPGNLSRAAVRLVLGGIDALLLILAITATIEPVLFFLMIAVTGLIVLTQEWVFYRKFI